jgi:DNA-binding response OmpR family regulator
LEAAVPKILVIDDDPSVRSLVADSLEIEGYEVHTAEDGFSGLRAIEAHKPDCVLLDVMMPGLDGHQVLQRIRAAEDRPALPVVMLTAYSDDATAWQAWTEGVDYFLAKPFDADELLRYLDYLFEGTALIS